MNSIFSVPEEPFSSWGNLPSLESAAQGMSSPFNISGEEKLILLSLNEYSSCISKKIAGILRRKFAGYLLKGLRASAKFIDPQE